MPAKKKKAVKHRIEKSESPSTRKTGPQRVVPPPPPPPAAAAAAAAPYVPAPIFRSLYYGDNIDVLRRNIPSESVDLCYIDPPFNSKRNYNQIYNNVGGEVDKAQAQAFVDTWKWDDKASAGFVEITTNEGGRFPGKLIDLVSGLHRVLGEGNLFAYLIHMSQRLVEIHRVLKPTGSFYLHCDPTASHYLKLLCDAIFCSSGGDFKNEIIWRRAGSHNKATRFGPIHDVIFFYTKSQNYYFTSLFRPYTKGHVESYFKSEDANGKYWTNALTGAGTRNGESGEVWRGFDPTSHGRHWAIPGRVAEELNIDPDLGTLAKLDAMAAAGSIDIPKDGSEAMPTYRQYLSQSRGIPAQDIWAYQPHTAGVLSGSMECIDEDVKWLGSQGDDERLGYPTQKPEGLLGRIIASSSKEGM